MKIEKQIVITIDVHGDDHYGIERASTAALKLIGEGYESKTGAGFSFHTETLSNIE